MRDGDIKDNIQLLFDKIVEYKDLQRAILELKSKIEVLQKLQNDLHNNLKNTKTCNNTSNIDDLKSHRELGNL